ncbi:MAG: hypothetical protein RJA37_211 [Verrucomicrobiota bacterium]|jgi:hypothetical protein
MNRFLLLTAALLCGCSTVLETGDTLERAITPPDGVNYAVTRPEGGFRLDVSDGRFASKVELLAVRKSRTRGGFTQVQFDLRNTSYLRQTANFGFEWIDAAGSVTEGQSGWSPTPLEPGQITTVTATALRSDSAECRLRILAR